MLGKYKCIEADHGAHFPLAARCNHCRDLLKHRTDCKATSRRDSTRLDHMTDWNHTCGCLHRSLIVCRKVKHSDINRALDANALCHNFCPVDRNGALAMANLKHRIGAVQWNLLRDTAFCRVFHLKRLKMGCLVARVDFLCRGIGITEQVHLFFEI